MGRARNRHKAKRTGFSLSGRSKEYRRREKRLGRIFPQDSWLFWGLGGGQRYDKERKRAGLN